MKTIFLPSEFKNCWDKISFFESENRNGKYSKISIPFTSIEIEKNGFSVVRDFAGHGVGLDLHEEPMIPNYGRKGRGLKIENGMVLAIEPMVNVGTYKVAIMPDGWTVVTRDGKRSAHFEHSVAIIDGNAVVLSELD